MAGACSQHLVTKIRRGIHNQTGSSRLYQDTAAQPVIMHIRRGTHLALASDHRYAGTGAGAKKCYGKGWVAHVSNLSQIG